MLTSPEIMNEFVRPMKPSMDGLAALVFFNALFLVSRHARTFALYRHDSTLGWLGLVVVPLRFAAKVGAWVFGFATILYFLFVAQDFGFRPAAVMGFIGFALAFGINYLISRYEQKLYPRGEHGTARPLSNS